jgi:hypothetical protein
MTLKNAHLNNVTNGDKTTKFGVSTGPAKTSATRDAEYGPRSTLVPDGNYKLTCRHAQYFTERKRGGVVTKLAAAKVEARWEVFDPSGKSLGVFRNEHSLPYQKSDGDDVSGSEQFWSNMGRSFAESEGKLDAYLAREENAWSPGWMEGKSGWARLEQGVGSQGGKFTNLRYFMGKAEYEAAPGAAAGDGYIPPKQEGKQEVASQGSSGGGEVEGDYVDSIDDDSIPF